MEEQKVWTREVINLINKILSSATVFVAGISINEPYYTVDIICDELTYNPPMFWRANNIYADDRLYIRMEINVSDLFRLMY